VCQKVSGPLRHHDADHNEEELVDVVGDLDHDNCEGDGETSHTGEE